MIIYMANGGSGLLIIMFGALLLGGVGLYYITRGKGPSPSDFELDVTKDPSTGNIEVTGTNLDMGGIAFNPSRQLFIDTTFTDSPGVPIISGRSPYRRIPTGTCKCDTYNCCYEGTYQPKYGHIETKKACAEVTWGDPVDACKRAVERFDNDIFDPSWHMTRRARSGRVSKVNRARSR
jgi:hypothetical protein